MNILDWMADLIHNEQTVFDNAVYDAENDAAYFFYRDGRVFKASLCTSKEEIDEVADRLGVDSGYGEVVTSSLSTLKVLDAGGVEHLFSGDEHDFLRFGDLALSQGNEEAWQFLMGLKQRGAIKDGEGGQAEMTFDWNNPVDSIENWLN